MAMDQKALKAVEKVDSCCDVVSCLELPNIELGRRKMMLGLVVLNMKVGQSE